jgi:tRNA-modifying protein YgfZ
MQLDLQTHFRPHRYARLELFAGFCARGDDVESFLQGQLTNDVKALSPTHWQRTGYCTPKGRLMASFLQWQIGPKAIGHLLPQEILEPVAKRLRMFVLRSKVVFENLDSPSVAIGLWGAAVGEFGKDQQCVNLSGTETGPRLLAEKPCPVLGERCWLIFNASHAEAVMQSLAGCEEISQLAWLFSEIQNAKAWIWKATQEAFVPQMVNFEITGGVSFTKGCYPGQEVVARSQYLGKLKRRSFRADFDHAISKADVLLLCGQDIWSQGYETEPCGKVVGAAPRFDSNGRAAGGAALLVECTLEAWEKGGLHVGEPRGPLLTAKTLPYEFPAAE